MKFFYSMILIASMGFGNLITAQPVIASFSPTFGVPGTVVTIKGSNFNTTPANNIVFFGAAKATVNTATTVSLNVTVPNGANYQYISVTDLSTQLTAYTLLPFNVTSHLCNDSVFFSTNLSVPAGVNINNVALGDLDGDGFTDIVSVDARLGAGNAGYVSVVRNNSTIGNISFAHEVKFETGAYPVGIAIGDLNGDGKPDLAIANSGSNSISLFKNASTVGNISLLPDVSLQTGAEPYCVSINDLDGDGKSEIAVANFQSNTVSIYRNTTTNGTISFSSNVDFVSAVEPYSIAIGDLNGDKKPDLGVSCMLSDKVSIFKNTSTIGTLSFATKMDLTPGTAPYVILMGDLNLDGNLDLAVVNSGSSSVSVFKNTSTMDSITFAPKMDFTTGQGPLSVSIGDLDGDGRPELATSNGNSQNISVLKNTSSIATISFNTHKDFAKNDMGWGNDPVGDLDGDGSQEIVTGGTYNIGVLKGKCVTGMNEIAETKFTLFIYPNPFYASATIEIPAEIKNADLTIYNSFGQLVKTIHVNGISVKIERDNLCSGIYFYKLSENSNCVSSGKLIVEE